MMPAQRTDNGIGFTIICRHKHCNIVYIYIYIYRHGAVGTSKALFTLAAESAKDGPITSATCLHKDMFPPFLFLWKYERGREERSKWTGDRTFSNVVLHDCKSSVDGLIHILVIAVTVKLHIETCGVSKGHLEAVIATTNCSSDHYTSLLNPPHIQKAQLGRKS
jgi:hypothetical protein